MTFWWLLISALSIIPLLKLLPFFGINKYWAVAAVIPLGLVGLLWYMAINLQELEKR